MRRFLYGALGTAVAGCGFSNATEGDGGPPPPDACVTYSAQLDTCKLPMGPALELSGMLEMNTTTGALIDKVTGVTITITTMSVGTLEAPVQAILAERVTFAPNTTLRAIGPRGLAIVSSHSITLGANALIDVSNNGAGARLSVCDPRGPTKGENDAGGAGGGGGAGFGGAGGKGGDGNGDDVVGNRSAGGDPGIAVEAPLGPRGGCPGAPGGDGDEPGGPGGRGGGAVWLAAGHTIALAAGAGINAGGGGGSGGTRVTSQGDAGGGGGGSGGVIWIEAPHVKSLGILAANGGGGGEGSGGDTAGVSGTSGRLSVERAAGGTGTSSGAAGGAGGHKQDPKGLIAANPDPGGGGGGGGGVGFIRVLSPDLTLGTVSP